MIALRSHVSAASSGASGALADSLTVVPLLFLLLAVRINEDARTVQLAIPPLSAIHAAIRPREGAFAMFSVVLVTTLISGTIWPAHLSEALHVTDSPLAAVSSPVGKLVASFTIHLIMSILPFVFKSCSRSEDTRTMLAPHPELAFITCTICVALNATARLLVLTPFALIGAPVNVDVFAIAMHLVVVPLSVVGATISPSEDAAAMCLTICKCAGVANSVLTVKDALPMSHLALPLASIGVTTLHLDLHALLQAIQVVAL
eukprot:CAMPEP_0115384474 /NCGR_PEP_ID=MMETSP0271-20121206/7126_1 /TAXON_ID=71861 /ORGANISM="Scrippsiella trochoidea, Strain CCMP3099" /LENGTH=259 /DNA_ID=CAMNT_0002807829 /DNA_START=51 /DNA_END=829 /DNA_ORIENTATION=+